MLVINIINSIIYITCFVVEGVAVGCGWQTLVAYINVGCYYAVGVPLGSLLGFYFKLGVKVHYCSMQ